MRKMLAIVAMSCLLFVPSVTWAQFIPEQGSNVGPEELLENYRKAFDDWLANVSFRAEFELQDRQYADFAKAREDVDGKPIHGTPVMQGLLAKRGSTMRFSEKYKGGAVEIARNALQNVESDTIRNERIAAHYVPVQAKNFGGYVTIQRVPDSSLSLQLQVPTPLTTGFAPVADLLKDKLSREIPEKASAFHFVVWDSRAPLPRFGPMFEFGDKLRRHTIFEVTKTGPRLVAADLTISEDAKQYQQLTCQYSEFVAVKNGDIPTQCRAFAGRPRTSDPVIAKEWRAIGQPTEASDEDFRFSLPADTRVEGMKVPPKPIDGRLVIDLDKIALEDLTEPAAER